jgi:hypothetical protein
MPVLPAGASRFSVLELMVFPMAPDAPPDPMENDQLRLARLLIPPNALLIPGRWSKLAGRLVEYPVKSPGEMATPLNTIPALARTEGGMATSPVAAVVLLLTEALALLLASALTLARRPRVCGDSDSWGQLCVPTEHISLSGTRAHTWLV